MNIREIEACVNEYISSAGDQHFFNRENVRIFPGVSAGAQDASHEMFRRLPMLIDGHRLPAEIFLSEQVDHRTPGTLTVLSFAFHINHRIVDENSRERLYPAYSWYEARKKFDLIFQPCIEFIKTVFPGRRIIVPVKSSLYRADLSKNIPVANWSERHVAFACGLGSFGLHGALITEKGCTHRLLSVIVDTEVEGCADPPDNPYRLCRHFADGSCGECMTRCPVDAIIPGKHVIERCYEHEWMSCRMKSPEIFGTEVPACGLCMCGVPCDTVNPV